MANNIKFMNLRVANIGQVKYTFNDNTEVTHNITSLDSGDAATSGTWFAQNSPKVPVTIEALEQSWNIAELPAEVKYPDDQIGQLTHEETKDPVTGDAWIIDYMDRLPT